MGELPAHKFELQPLVAPRGKIGLLTKLGETQVFDPFLFEKDTLMNFTNIVTNINGLAYLCAIYRGFVADQLSRLSRLLYTNNGFSLGLAFGLTSLKTSDVMLAELL